MRSLAAVRFGLVLSLVAVVYGWSLGAVFGFAEYRIREGFVASANARMDLYLASSHGDAAAAQAAIRKVDETAWRYLLRAHLHAGGIGALALGMSVVLAMLAVPGAWKSATSLLLGVGAVGYPLFWMLAGWMAPGMGSAKVAKEALRWLAVPSAGCLLVGGVLTLVLVAYDLFRAGARDGAVSVAVVEPAA